MDPDNPGPGTGPKVKPGTQPEPDSVNPITWVLERPQILVAIAAIAALIYLYLKAKKLYTQKTGTPPPPIGRHALELLTIAYREDNRPVHAKVPWLTWTRLTSALTITAIAAAALKLWAPAVGLTVLAVLTALHASTIYRIRRSVVQQMTDVAIGEMTAAGVDVTKWRNLVYPATTIVNHPAKYRSSDLSTRERFETNFTASTADSHGWIYTWEPHRNRVICEPTPLLPTKAKYPSGPATHAWDRIPLGVTADGDTATVDLSVFPHLLLTGSTGSGKSCSLRTPIPTPSGWTTMGALQPGDHVFDENGNPCTVTWVSDVDEQPDLYAVEFSDGSVVEADAEHLWFTETRSSHISASRHERNDAQRRPLLTPEATAWVHQLLQSSTDSDEITLTQFAAGIGISEATVWLREITDSLGPVGEIQVVKKFHYSPQVVRQKQKVRVYDAREAWSALGSYRSKAERTWGAVADGVASGELRLDCSSVSSLKELSARCGVGVGTLKTALLRLGVRSVRPADAHPLAPHVYVAGEVWSTRAPLAAQGAPTWGDQRTNFAQRAHEAAPGSVVTSIELAEVLGVDGPAAAACVMRDCKVSSRVEERTVELTVPGKTVERKGRFSRTYLTQLLCKAVLERTERPAHSQEHKRARGSVKTTREIAETLFTESGHHNHSIPVAQALELTEVSLPIDPYVLGAWLGDGSSRRGEVCGIDHEVASNMQSAGYAVEERTVPLSVCEHPDFRIWFSQRLHSELRQLGLIQRNTPEGTRKRFPDTYLRASINQRRDLLAGLLDTDGTVAPQGACQFTNTNETLAQQVHELAISLGYRATLTSGVKRAQTGDGVVAWAVAWTCAESPFRLTRKTQAHLERNANFSPARNNSRYITAVRKIPPSPARCIQVNSPSRLFLAGEAMIPTHNSVTQRSIMLHAMRSAHWKVVCVDLKRVELSAFKDKKNVLRVAVELEDALAVLRGAESEMHRRYKEMEVAGAQKYKEYKPDAPALLVMVDELFALLAMEKTKDEETKERDMMRGQCTGILSSIARLGRGAGVHLVLATQRPDATILPGELKALALDTPIPTPSGWSTMGELTVGDEVFDERGERCQVVGATEVMVGNRVFEVKFSDGSSLFADAGHQWVTHAGIGLEGNSTKTLSSPSVVTTLQIFESLTCGAKSDHAIAVAGALRLARAELPLEPFALGVWLGGGSPTVEGALRDLGVLDEKHIPDAYLRASAEQRLELLAGLMEAGSDTYFGGLNSSSADAGVSQVVYRTTDKVLAGDVHELVLSMGWVATFVVDADRVSSGYPEGRVSYVVRWTPNRLLAGLGGKSGARNMGVVSSALGARYRIVLDVVEVESVPVRCIQVDSPSRMYLAGRSMIPTHNSNLDARIAMGRMDMTPSLMVLDSDRATRTPKIAGRGVLRQGADLIEFQGYWIGTSDLDYVIAQDELLAAGGENEILDEPVVGKGNRKPSSSATGRRGGVALPGVLVKVRSWWLSRVERAQSHDAAYTNQEPEASHVSHSSSGENVDVAQLMAAESEHEYSPMPSDLRQSMGATGGPMALPPLPAGTAPTHGANTGASHATSAQGALPFPPRSHAGQVHSPQHLNPAPPMPIDTVSPLNLPSSPSERELETDEQTQTAVPPAQRPLPPWMAN